MRLENFNNQMEKIIKDLSKNGEKPSLLLHSCCAPCSSACLERLKDFFDLTVYYYNPNLDNQKEFDLRASEQQRLCEEFKVKCIVEKYIPQEFFLFVKGFENCVEGGERCEKCFSLRLDKTAKKANEIGAEYFTTTLTISPLKNAKLINYLGEKIAENNGVKFLPTDFKKKGGYQRSIELSKEFGLYRQNYCGCVFSKNSIPSVN